MQLFVQILELIYGTYNTPTGVAINFPSRQPKPKFCWELSRNVVWRFVTESIVNVRSEGSWVCSFVSIEYMYVVTQQLCP